jgi:hypothetical protein
MRWSGSAPGRPSAAGRSSETTAGSDAPVLLVATAIFQRSGHKYRDRTYRYVLADLGHALENLASRPRRSAVGALRDRVRRGRVWPRR